jgi:hypothetical protein
MGYTTDFDGVFLLDKPLKQKHAKYLTAFAQTRRMKRDEDITSEREDPIRVAAGLPVGKDGGYFVGEDGYMGQNMGMGVIGHDQPEGQPGPWCQWVPLHSEHPYSTPDIEDEDEDWEGFDCIGWDQGEKFYHYVEWLNYIINNFLEPWGYTLNGEVTWDGEDVGDIGVIEVCDNSISTHAGVLSLREVKTIEKAVLQKKELREVLESLADYLVVPESEDFLDTMEDCCKWRSDNEDEIGEAIEEIYNAIVKENKPPQDIIDLIDKHTTECAHIYVSVLRGLVISRQAWTA